MCIPHVKIILFTHHRMLRYAALRRELNTVIGRIYERGERVIVDYARENVHSLKDISTVRRMNENMIDHLSPESACALKMSSFGSRVSPKQARDHIDALIERAKEANVRVCIDAEDVLYPDFCFELVEKHNTNDAVHVYTTYQMYRKNAFAELIRDVQTAKMDDFKMGVKLVRGAYLRNQEGLFDTKDEVDSSYNKALAFLLNESHTHTILATHNNESLQLAQKFPRSGYATAQLLGMGCMETKVDYRYVPYGTFMELTPYLLRRLWERMSWG